MVSYVLGIPTSFGSGRRARPVTSMHARLGAEVNAQEVGIREYPYSVALHCRASG
jgi:hypothetical protein